MENTYLSTKLKIHECQNRVKQKIKICVWFFRLRWRVCLAFHAQSEFLGEPKCVERAIISTFQRAVARLQTLKPREMRTEKLKSGNLIMRHTLVQQKRELRYNNVFKVIDHLNYTRWIIARRAYCSQPLQKSMCVRPDRPTVRPTVRATNRGPI